MYGYGTGTVGWGVVLLGVATALSVIVVVAIWQAFRGWIWQETVPAAAGLASEQPVGGRIERLGRAAVHRRVAADRISDRMA